MTPFKIAMVFTADTAGAKAGVTDLSGTMRAVGTEATKTGAAAKKGAADLDALAAAAKAALAHDDLAAAEKRAAAKPASSPLLVLANPVSPAPMVAAFRAAETAADSMRASVAGLGATVGSQAKDMLEAARSAATYQAALDDIRASYNPLFAASRQYEQQLDRIAEAERLGAINAREAAAARQAAAAQLGPAGQLAPGAGGISSMYTSNVAAQGFDIGVTAAMGMHPLMIGLQQGSQLAQVATQMGGGKAALTGIAQGFMSLISPTTLATIALTTFGAVGIQWLMKLGGETKSLEEAMADLEDSVGRLKDVNANARRGFADLAGEFGSTTEDAQKLLDVLAEIERRTAGRSAQATMSSLVNELGGGSMLGLRSESDQFGSLQRLFGEASWLTSGRISESGSPLSFAVNTAMDGVIAAGKTDDIEAQIAAVETLFDAVTTAAEAFGGLSKEEDAWLGKIGQALADLQRIKGLDENAAGIAQAEAMRVSLEKQIQLERTSLLYGEDSAEMRAIQARHEREAAIAKLEGLKVDLDSAEAKRVLNGLTEIQYYREKAAAEARREWFVAQDDQLAAVQREIALIGMSAAEQARINALAEAELEIRDRKLSALEAEEARTKAIAQAEAEIALSRQRALRDLAVQAQMDGYDARAAEARNPYIRADIEAERAYAQEIAASGDATIAAQAAAQARARAIREADRAQTDFLRGQAEGIQAQQLEIALIGQSAAVRARILALVQAEQEITRLGASGEAADAIRETARAQAEMAQQLDAQVDAWRRVQAAGEGAIDGVLDKLRGGDVGGAFKEMIGEIEKGFFDLAVANPLKNMLLGTNLGTWEDVGGWGGIWGRMSGKQPLDEAATIAAATMPGQSMSVNAANVILSGNLAGLGAANMPIAPVQPFGGTLPGSADVQAQVWAFFAAKGLAPHQIAGIMGNVAGESSFNPLAMGDGGDAFGLFQHNDRRFKLFDFIGGQQNLGDVQKQLEFVWHELMTSENAAYQRLMASTDVRGATDAFMRGFERPSDKAIADSWGTRLAAAEAAMGQFEGATITAQQQLGQLGTGAAQLGTGLQSFGSGLAGAIGQAGASHGIGGLLGAGLLTDLGRMIGIPGFQTGSWTGPGADTDVAGLVHANEFVFDAAATRRIGVANLEAIRRGTMRGYLSGGHVTSRGAPPMAVPANASAAPQGAREPVVFHINVSGTGDAQLQAGVHQAIAQAIETYDRHAVPDRVRVLINDRWGS
ncbi:phage tail tip lysozyme [Paracoccus sp. 22332]|uniref:phage tail tip lysozyme n=1 Tax=Paracoccus sp. 22332 TaxID=3453913 RepID=UPI003F864603